MTSGGIAAVVVAYNSASLIESCVDRARRVPGVETVVVVDHGGDGSGDLVRDFAIVLTDERNPGFGAGQNRGVAATSCGFVLLLNPDAQLEVDAVRVGLDLLARDERVAMVQGVVLGADGYPERSHGQLGPVHLVGRILGARRWLRFRLVARVARRSDHLADHVSRVPERAVEVESLAATAVLVRRSAFDEVGGFDPTYFMYGEDLDLCRRLREAGWKLVAMPEVWARHVGGASSTSWWRREVLWWRGTLFFAADHWRMRSFVLAIVCGAVRACLLACRAPDRTARREVLSNLLLEPIRRRRSGRPYQLPSRIGP